MDPILPAHRLRLSTRARIQNDRVTGKTILLYPEGVLILNATGQAVLSHCGGTESLEQIIANLVKTYDVSQDQISAEVLVFLDRLRA